MNAHIEPIEAPPPNRPASANAVAFEVHTGDESDTVDLSQDGFYVWLKIGQGPKSKRDPKAAEHIKALYHLAENDLVNVSKKLFEGARDTMARLEGRARKVHKSLTLSVSGGDPRLLPYSRVNEYQAEMEPLRDAFMEERGAFLANYQVLLAHEAARWVDGFDAQNYLDADEMGKAIRFDVITKAVAPQEVLESLDPDIREWLMADNQNETRRMREAMRRRLIEPLQAWHDRLMTPKARKLADLLDKLEQCVDFLESFRSVSDPTLNAVFQSLRDDVLSLDCQTLRADNPARLIAAQQAQALLKRLQASC